MLFPIALLHHSVKKNFARKFPQTSEFIDRLFICGEHFEAKGKYFQRRDIRTHSIEWINKELKDGTLSFNFDNRTPRLFFQTLVGIHKRRGNANPVQMELLKYEGVEEAEDLIRLEALTTVNTMFIYTYVNDFNKEHEQKPR